MFEFIDVDQFLVFDSLFVLEKKPVSPKIRDRTYHFFSLISYQMHLINATEYPKYQSNLMSEPFILVKTKSK